MEPWIHNAGARLATAFDAERVLLFGSHATGQATRKSDVDFLIVCRTQLDPMARLEKGLRAVGELPAPVDVVVLTPQELESRRHLPFLARALAEGKLLYERPEASGRMLSLASPSHG